MRLTTRELLPSVIQAVEAAGERLRHECRRPAGPRGHGDKAAVDREIEHDLRAALLALTPARFVGEETGSAGDAASTLCWLVDPHDGTKAFLEGQRGTAVSVALLCQGVPVLGVVYAPMSPDRGPDLIAWAEGLEGIWRNGQVVPIDLARRRLEPGAIVFLHHAATHEPLRFGRAVAPARFVALPSIAYRLARVAAGDGVAAVSLSTPCSLDYAAGHALLRGAGGVLLDERGQAVRYTREGSGEVARCFGGAPQAAAELAGRSWARAAGEAARPSRVRLPWPRSADETALDRAVGCLLGQVIGDSLGALVEFQGPAAIRRQHPEGVRELRDGGVWNTLAGQPTDDSELALALARTLAATGAHDPEAVAAAYGSWRASQPFDIGSTTSRALTAAMQAPGNKAAAAMAAANAVSQANGSLMRVAPIGIWAASPEAAAAHAAADSRLTHPHPVCVAACAAYAAAISAGIQSGSRAAMLRAAEAAAGQGEGGDLVLETLRAAMAGRWPADYVHNMGWVLIALQNAFYHLAHADTVEEALVATVGAGGDTDTNAAIAGALLGAALGRRAFPSRWVLPVLACRPMRELGAGQPRPADYWPDDLPALAEALLAGRQRPRSQADMNGEP
jgi:ADP-ribosylglycohydrolase/fructose-1,6-bisphosphatase/inositol monophosphatase family enzyme